MHVILETKNANSRQKYLLTLSHLNGFGCAEHETDPTDFDGLYRPEFWEFRGAPRGVDDPLEGL